MRLLPNGHPAPCRRADVLYSPAALGKHDAKASEHRRMFFTCESLPFEEVVPRWCEAHGRLQAATMKRSRSSCQTSPAGRR